MKKYALLLIATIVCSCFAYAQPSADPWNGVCYAVKDYMKENANDPKSIKYAECSYILKFNTGKYGQRVKYRGKNAFGAVVLNENFFVIEGEGFNAKVTGIISMSTLEALFNSGKLSVVAKYDSSGKKVPGS